MVQANTKVTVTAEGTYKGATCTVVGSSGEFVLLATEKGVALCVLRGEIEFIYDGGKE